MLSLKIYNKSDTSNKK